MTSGEIFGAVLAILFLIPFGVVAWCGMIVACLHCWRMARNILSGKDAFE
jgi:hypothetical protein